MSRNRRTDVRFPIYSGYRVRVIQARNIARTCGLLRVPGADDCRGIFIAGEGGGWLVLGMEPDESTVAHEASHAVAELFRYVGARRDDEAFAYHLDYLVGRIHKFLRGKRCS